MKIFFVILLVVSSSGLVNARELNTSKGLLDSYVIAKSEEYPEGLTKKEMEEKPYAVHVVSYINEKDAKSHVEELKIQEKDAYYVPASVRGQIWYKVCVGHFTAKNDAEAYRKTFMKRMSEPLSTVISLVETDSATNVVHRGVASVTATPATEAEIEKKPMTETMPAPEAKAVSEVKPVTEVKTVPEVKPVAEVKTVPEAKSADVLEFFSIQVGAFETEKIAKAKIEKLQIKDQDIFYQEATVNGQKWYRVLVGKFETKKSAESYQVALKSQANGIDGFVRKVKDGE